MAFGYIMVVMLIFLYYNYYLLLYIAHCSAVTCVSAFSMSDLFAND